MLFNILGSVTSVSTVWMHPSQVYKAFWERVPPQLWRSFWKLCILYSNSYFFWAAGLMVVVETVQRSVVWEMLPRYSPTPTSPCMNWSLVVGQKPRLGDLV